MNRFDKEITNLTSARDKAITSLTSKNVSVESLKVKDLPGKIGEIKTRPTLIVKQTVNWEGYEFSYQIDNENFSLTGNSSKTLHFSPGTKQIKVDFNRNGGYAEKIINGQSKGYVIPKPQALQNFTDSITLNMGDKITLEYRITITIS